MLSDQDLQRIAPFELVKVAGARVAATWQELQARDDGVPVLLGGRDSASQVLEALRQSEVISGAGAVRGTSLDVDAWMAQRVAGRPEHFATARIDVPWDGVARPLTPFVPAYDHRGEPYPEVFFALIPVGDPWRVPVYLRGDACNDCPDAAVHLALFRRWHERFGAVVTTMADAVIEMHVARPPASLEAARALAWEHFVYCPDSVHQGAGTLGNLAGSLLGSPHWYFWWS